MKVVELKALAKGRGLRGYSKLKKDELITFLQNNLRPTPAPRPKPMPSVRLRQPDSQNPRPYQLKPKRGKVNKAKTDQKYEEKVR